MVESFELMNNLVLVILMKIECNKVAERGKIYINIIEPMMKSELTVTNHHWTIFSISQESSVKNCL